MDDNRICGKLYITDLADYNDDMEEIQNVEGRQMKLIGSEIIGLLMMLCMFIGTAHADEYNSGYEAGYYRGAVDGGYGTEYGSGVADGGYDAYVEDRQRAEDETSANKERMQSGYDAMDEMAASGRRYAGQE